MPSLARISGTLAGVLLLTPGSALAQEEPPEELRCFDLAVGPWSGTSEPAMDSIYRLPPPRVELLPRSGDPAGSRGLEVREVEGAIPSVHEYSSWRFSPGLDTLYLGWSTGFSGFSGALVREQGRYQGRIESFTDVAGQPPDTARMVATPIDCSTPLREQHTRQHPVPRGVELATGDSVRLGTPLDELTDVEQIAGYRRVELRTALAPPFAGANDVELLPDGEGRIAILRFRLPQGTNFESLVRAIEDEYGPPTRRAPNPPRAIPGEWATWENRTSQFSLHLTLPQTGGAMVGVLLSLHRIRR